MKNHYHFRVAGPYYQLLNGSSLNLIEPLFGKMAKTLLRDVWLASADELKVRVELHKRGQRDASSLSLEAEAGED